MYLDFFLHCRILITLNKMDIEKTCASTIALCTKVKEYILSEFRIFSSDKIRAKGLHDFVSFVDTTAEEQIVRGLKTILPEAGFITEEGTETETKQDYNWIVDPLDGTTNFIHGLSPFAISIALIFREKVIMGIVYEISLDECFYAWEGSPAYLNGKEIKVSESSHIKDSLIATGFPYYDYSRMSSFLKSFDYFMKNSHGLRRLGSAATDLAYVACGRFEAFYEYSLQPWDVAAGAFIVQQAGGKVADFKLGNNYIFGKEIIATNNNVYEEFSEKIKEVFSGV